MERNQSDSGPRSNRRAVLKRIGAVGVGASVPTTSVLTTPERGVVSAASGTTLNVGERKRMRVTDERVGCCDLEWHADNNWTLELLDIDTQAQAYTFGISAFFHTYKADTARTGANQFIPKKWINEARFDVELEWVDDDETRIVPSGQDGEGYTRVQSMDGPTWRDWRNANWSEDPASKSELEDRYQTNNYYNYDIPGWMSVFGFGAGLAASGPVGAGISLTAGGASYAISTLSIADRIAENLFGCGSTKKDDRYTPKKFYRWWPFCNGGRTLASFNSQFKVYVGGGEVDDVNLKIYKSFVPSGSYESTFKPNEEYDADNAGFWRVRIPADGTSEPTLMEETTFYDGDGHPHPY